MYVYMYVCNPTYACMYVCMYYYVYMCVLIVKRAQEGVETLHNLLNK